MAASLYRKYRPQRFADLVGQEHVARALQNALAENRLAHAYLFSGTRGTGKTSSARILGQVLNCQRFSDGFPSEAAEIEPCGECESCISARAGNSFDVIELDAASNNGVDDMRDLIEKVSYTSSAGGTKVYIIDEVHELTGRASNALLKTLEEPPEHVVFILATTNPEKVLPTIRSRTQHFEFVALEEEKLFEHAKNVLSWEDKVLDDDTLHFVARKGAGSVRDTLSFLDQVLALDVSSFEEFEKTQANLEVPIILDILMATANADIATAMSSLHELSHQGKEPRAIVENMISVARDCLVVSLNPETTILLSNHNDKDELKNIGDKCGTNFLRQFILKMGKAVADMRGTASLNPLLNVEMALLSSMTPGGPVAEPIPGSVDKSASAEFQGAASSTSSGPANARGFQPRDPVAGRTSDLSKPPSAESLETSKTVKAPFMGKEPVKAPDDAANGEISQPPTRRGKATLGAVKSGSAPAPAEEVAQAKPAKKFSIVDVASVWPKVMGLLSPASQEALRTIEPTKLDGDVLYFQGPADQLDEIKARFKKDASIIRGFLESMLEKTFRFQIIAADTKAQQAQEKEILEESQEYDAVDHVVELFGGEVVPES
jgi:DNA polymerase-3 subunit gamma/tau